MEFNTRGKFENTNGVISIHKSKDSQCNGWFSPGTPGFSTNKPDRHDINEILLKVALNTTNQSIHSIVKTLQLMFKTLTTLKSNHPYNDLQIYSCSLICKPLYLNFNALFPT
jgi:hypothetical protein